MRRPPYWLTGILLTVAVLAMLASVVFIPLLLHPTLSDAELRGVSDVQQRVALQQEQAKLQNDARSTLLQGFGGLLLVVGALSTWRQVHISRHGQITDRISRAVEQLASESINVRLGGLYALERVAKNSYEDRTTITSILTAFVRTHAPSPAKDRTTLASILAAFVRTHAPWPARAPDDHQHPTPALHDSQHELGTRAMDVQLALFVLAYRHHAGDQRPPYLSFTDLRGARMGHEGWWRDLICEQSNLVGARLREAHLEGAVLNGSDLRQAHLPAARLVNAKLVGAHLQGANLQKADLRGADLTGACLDRADLTDARTDEHTTLTGARTDERTKWPAGFDPTHHGLGPGS